MKKNKFIRILIFGLIFIQFSCEKDLYDEYFNSEKHPILVQRKNFEDLRKNKKLMNSIERFTLKSDRSLQRQYYDSINNFYLDLDNVMFTLDSLNNQTYTFKINRIPSNSMFENLILKSSKIGGFDAILAQYNQNIMNLNSVIPQEIQNSIHQNVNFLYLGKKNISEINSKFVYSGGCFEPGYVYMSGHSCASGEHTFANGANCDYWGTTDMATTGGYVFTMESVPCPGGGGGGSSGGFSTGPHGGGGSDEFPLPPDPCKLIKKLKLDTNFKARFTGMVEEARQWGFERGQLLTPKTTPLPANNYSYTPINGSVAKPNIENITFLSGQIGFLHTHFDGLNSVFSPEDLALLYNIIKTPGFNPEFFFGLATSNSLYNLQVEDVDAFIAFGDKYLSDDNKIRKFKKEIYTKDNKYNLDSDDYIANDRNFTKMMKDLNMGVSLSGIIFAPNIVVTELMANNLPKRTYNSTENKVDLNNCY